jgi:transcriptional regulator with XRE-family HTH domain
MYLQRKENNMKSFAEKVREARDLLNLNQQQLGDLTGVSKRSIAAYETEGVIPRPRMIRKLAEVLNVSDAYLDNDDIEDPTYGMRKTDYIEETRARFGDKAAKEISFLLERNTALFAGGAVSQEAKDAFFEALMKSYLICKEQAREAYGHK